MKKRRWRWLLLILVLATILLFVYVENNPLIFNESLWQHAHCIKIASFELWGYAESHGGKFPYQPKGYGNALLLLDETTFHTLTGPGYDAAPFHDAKRNGVELSEEDCGRVYIQGLTQKSNPEIAILFDKIPTPGGDHCHFPNRLWAPLCREVCLVGPGTTRRIEETEWPEFAKKQVELLVREGFPRKEAERLYSISP
jgi:hypothetical protein